LPLQQCPACGVLLDVGIFVSGQRVRCSSCGLPFNVQRFDSMLADPVLLEQPAGRGHIRQTALGQAGRALQREPMAAAQAHSPKADPPPMQKPAAQRHDTSPGENGTSIPGFELQEVIGKGGMGKVFKAKQLSLDRCVAIKVLNEDLAKHGTFIKRFEKETASLAALNHPNITSIFDRGSSSGTYYFVMEYVEGPSLRQRMNRGNLSLPQLADIFIKLCKAIEHAHQHGVIHRDLKPENILFTREGVLKVADFGLANILAQDRRWELTHTQVSMGTVNYMAPEQRRDAKHVDHRADIFSLGVMLYEALVGELPMGHFDPPSRRRKDIDERLDRLVLKMLDFEPDRRPQRADLVAESLKSIFSRLAPREENPAPKTVKPSEDPEDLPEAPVSEKSIENPPAVAMEQQIQPPPAKPDPKPAAPKEVRIPRRRFSKTISLLLLATVLLLAALAVSFSLFFKPSKTQPGDILWTKGPSGIHSQETHHRRVNQVPPSSSRKEGKTTATRFEFTSSTMPPIPLTFIGGDWLVQPGALVQDTCRTTLTINQAPATALFGSAPAPTEGMSLRLKMDIDRTLFSVDGKPMSMREAFQRIGRPSLPDASTPSRAGLGFVDKDGKGIRVLFPVERGERGWIERPGEGMEGREHEFDVPPPEESSPNEITLASAEGRIRLTVGNTVVFDELSGFPLGFSAFPAIFCQNARCTVRTVEYQVPAERF
jgi:serine/threonine protein kinase